MIRRPPRSTLFPYTRSSDLAGLRKGWRVVAFRGWQEARLALLRASGAWPRLAARPARRRSEEHTSELQSQSNLVCRLLLEKKKTRNTTHNRNVSTNDRESHT